MNIWIFSDSILALSQGFMLCASLIIAIGPQNLFVLRQGLCRQHLFTVALLSTLADLFLISVGVGGLGTLISTNALLLTAATLGGATFLLGYGVCSFRSAWRYQTVASEGSSNVATASLQRTVWTTLSFSLLNPAAYIDTILMVGTASGQYPLDERLLFGAGAVMASGIWFFTLTYASGRLAPYLGHPTTWQTLDVISGLIMFGIAISMSIHHELPHQLVEIALLF